MAGAIVIALVIVVVLPVVMLVSGSVIAGILGWSLKDNGEQTHEGSELIDLNT